MLNKPIRISSGAAWWGDRVEAAIFNAEKGDLDYHCFETMAEATVSAAQVRARQGICFWFDATADSSRRSKKHFRVWSS